MARLIDKLYGNLEAEQTIVSSFQSIHKSEENIFDKSLDKLNENFNKGIITEQSYEKALGELDVLIEKAFQHKYIKRTGTPGKYKYWYKESKKTGSHLSVGDIYEHSGGKARIEDIYVDEASGKKMVDYKHINEKGVHSNETQTLSGFLQSHGKKLGEGGKEFESKKEDVIEDKIEIGDKVKFKSGETGIVKEVNYKENIRHSPYSKDTKENVSEYKVLPDSRKNDNNPGAIVKVSHNEIEKVTKEQSKQTEKKDEITKDNLSELEKKAKKMSVDEIKDVIDKLSKISESDKISDRDRVDYMTTQSKLMGELLNKVKRGEKSAGDKSITLDTFKEVAKKSKDVDDFMKKVNEVKNVPPEVINEFQNKYGKSKYKTMQESALAFMKDSGWKEENKSGEKWNKVAYGNEEHLKYNHGIIIRGKEKSGNYSYSVYISGKYENVNSVEDAKSKIDNHFKKYQK